MAHFVNIALLLFFTTLGVTGVLSFFAPFSLVTTRVHVVFGFSMLVLVGLHLASRWRYFLRVLPMTAAKKRPHVSWRMLGSVVGLWAFLGTASLWNWAPVTQFIGLGYEAQHRATIFRSDPKAVFKPLGDEARLKRATGGDANLLAEIEWGPAFPTPYKRSPEPFEGGQPQMAIWAESNNGSLIETLFVSEQAAFGESMSWRGHKVDRVDILPVWRHRYTLKTGVTPDGDVAEYSGATPEHSFSLQSYLKTDSEPFYLYVEVNAPGDTNAYFHPRQDPEAGGYMEPGIGQPSVIYGAYIEPQEQGKYQLLDLVGHGGSSSQQDGNMHYDLEELTTAKRLIEKVLVRTVRSGTTNAVATGDAAEGSG